MFINYAQTSLLHIDLNDMLLLGPVYRIGKWNWEDSIVVFKRDKIVILIFKIIFKKDWEDIINENMINHRFILNEISYER